MADSLGRVTAAEVAEKAGVSVSTVSLALNGTGRVSAKTIERVRRIATQLNYVPHAQASSLRRQITHRIALVVPDIGNSVYVAIAKAVQQVARQHGYYVSLVSTDDIEGADVDALRLLQGGHADGMVLIALRSSKELERQLEATHKPICVIGKVPGNLGVDNVQADSLKGVKQAVLHLRQTGRSRLVFINGPLDTNPGILRLQGFQEIMGELGLPEKVVGSDFTLSGGQQAAEQALKQFPDADALVCANDLIGIGVLQYLRRRGVRVPEDIVVTGMDDIAECEMCSPTLTSVALHGSERGRMAAQFLFNRLLGEPSPTPIHIKIEPTLKVRESTGGAT